MEAQKIEFNLQSLHRKVNRLEEELRGQLFMLQLVIVAMAANEKARRERAQVARTTPVQPQDPLALFLTDVSLKLTAWLESMIETPGPFFIRATTTTAQNPSAQLIFSHDLDAASPYLVPLLITQALVTA